MTETPPEPDPEDDEFVDRLSQALSEEDWTTARTLGDQLAEVIGDVDPHPETLVARTENDPGGSIAAQAHLSEWILILESRRDFEAAADLELHLIDLLRRDVAAFGDSADRSSPDYIEDVESVLDQYEVRALRYLAFMDDPERAREAMAQAVEASRELGVPLDEDQRQFAAELGVPDVA